MIILTILALLFTVQVNANTSMIKIAVIDTGLNNINNRIPVCEGEHYIINGRSFQDKVGHGTKMSRLIKLYANGTQYCQVIIKISEKGQAKINAFTKAFRYLQTRKDIKIINISYGGHGYNNLNHRYIKDMLDEDRIIIAAAGNEQSNLNEECDYYPACYDKRIIVVGNGKNEYKRAPSSNYGDRIIDVWVDTSKYGKHSGTSSATAIFSGVVIRNLRKILDAKENN